MKKPRSKQGGFSIIELAVVILIIGVVAAIAVPTYLNYRKKAISVEATTNLINIYKFEMQHFAENNTFTDSMSQLAFEAKSNPYYTYSLVATQLSFTAEARGNIDNDPDEDVWTVNDSQAIVHTSID